jgi:CIC family chloride channel protein
MMSPGSSLQQLRLREHQLFLALTIVVGILAGLSAVLFTVAIDWMTRLFFGLDPSMIRLFVVPVTVSLVTGALLAWVFPDVRGSGVPQTEAAYHLHKGVIPGRVPLGKFITGVLCIGSGHSMGREGPSVQIGAGLASLVGRWVPLSADRIKDLVPVGAAGALAAAFNTPVAAVLFALEEIIGDMNATLLGSTVVASVASVVVERSILGNEPLFRVPAYHLQHPIELLAYAALGIVGGAVSLAFCKSLLSARRLFMALPSWTRAWQPAIGGLIIGGLLVFSPQVMGVGYEYVDLALNGGLVFKTMMLSCVLKLVATTVSYSSGNAGGIFAPSLYIGAMAGGAVGTIVHRLAPVQTADAGAYALVGMGTLFAGIIRAPMTSVFMIFEITQDYQILVPLMVANLLSFLISRRFQPVPVYHALLQQDHVHLPSAATRVAPTSWTAADVMGSGMNFVSPGTSVQNLWETSGANGTSAFLVGTPERLVGLVTAQQLVAAMESGRCSNPIDSLLDLEIVHAHPDHRSETVLDRLAQSGGVLPVLSRDDAQRVVGVVTFADIMQFMRTRRAANANGARTPLEHATASISRASHTQPGS